MLKRSMLIMMAVVMMISLFLAACGNGNNGANGTGQSGGGNDGGDAGGSGNDSTSSISGEIIVAGWPSGDTAFEAIIPKFNELYPNVEVTLQFQASADHHKKLLTSLAAGAGAPDVAMVESGYVGGFRDKPGFVNLMDDPYNVAKYESDFVNYKWQMAVSIDGDQMIGLPWDIGPITLFYRRDIFEEVGLPSEPEKVQELLSTWEGYLDVARKVNIPGERWMVASAADVFMTPWMNRDFYNDDLSFRFDTKESLDLLEISQSIREEGLDAKVDLWGNEWGAMMKEGKIATQIAGSWFGGFIKDWVAPDTAGKWGVASIPGEVTNWGGSFLAIPEQSKNKEAAWAFIEFALATKEAQNDMFKAVDYFPAYIPAWDDPMYEEEDPFFGNMKTRKFWVSIAEKTKPSFVTMMDRQTETLLKSTVTTGLDQGMSPEEIMEKAKAEILQATEQDRQLMKELME
jgi:ABC-type glycerol-3-phosphate transport system substrate-binding protein